MLRIYILQTAYDLADNTFFSFFFFSFLISFRRNETIINSQQCTRARDYKYREKRSQMTRVDTRAIVRASGVANECTHTYMTYI